MKKSLILAAALATLAGASQAYTVVDNALVRIVEPQYENVTVPRQDCTNQWVN